MNMKNNGYKPIINLGNRYMILATKKRNEIEYVLASGYDAETNEWRSGHYSSDLDSCLVWYLRLRGNKNIKSRHQLAIEESTEITYERLDEIANGCMSMVVDNYSYTTEEIIDNFDLSEKEIEYFALNDMENEAW